MHRKLRRSFLVDPATGEGAGPGVVRAVCGVQAQVPAAAEACVAVRTEMLTRDQLRADIDRGLLTRTYAMRRTAYLLHGEDLPCYAAAMRRLLGEDTWFEAFGLDAGQAGRLFAGLAEILAAGPCARPDLARELRARLGDWVFRVFDETLADLSVAAAYAGVMVYGPSDGAKTTFARPPGWRPQWAEVDGAAALDELTCRYVAAYGPVTHAEFGRWLGTTAQVARGLIERQEGRLNRVTVTGQAAWADAGAAVPDLGVPPERVRLVPQYDCYILGAGQPEWLVPPAARELIRLRNRGRYEGAAGMPLLVIGGVVRGVWERRLAGRRLRVTVTPAARLSDAHRESLAQVAERLAGFVGARPVLVIDKPD